MGARLYDKDKCGAEKDCCFPNHRQILFFAVSESKERRRIFYENLSVLYPSLSDTRRFLSLSGLERAYHLPARLFGKMECFNPAGSVKDRVALEMLLRAEMAGEITKDSVIIEPTSGNTGIGLAALAASPRYARCYRDAGQHEPRADRLDAGIWRRSGVDAGRARHAGRRRTVPMCLPRNCRAVGLPGSLKTLPILRHMKKRRGPKFMRIRTGTSISLSRGSEPAGLLPVSGRYLKAEKPEVKIVAVEPASSPLLSGGHAGPHKIQGIGANFIPEILDREIYDEIFCVEDADAMWCGREIAKKEGILVGIFLRRRGFCRDSACKKAGERRQMDCRSVTQRSTVLRRCSGNRNAVQ